jgi:hypothetical protein
MINLNYIQKVVSETKLNESDLVRNKTKKVYENEM